MTRWVNEEGPYKTWMEGDLCSVSYQGQGDGGRWTMFVCPADWQTAEIYGKAFGKAPYSDEERKRYNHDPGPVRTWDLTPVLVAWVEVNGAPKLPTASLVVVLLDQDLPWLGGDSEFRTVLDVDPSQIRGLLGCSEADAQSMHQGLTHYYEQRALREGWGMP